VHFVPRLRAEGFDEALIEQIFVHSPARWLDW
jgi:predicted metal-dependent phosphotriesterase family hydrolase